MDFPVENLAIGYSPDFTSPYKWQNNLYKHVLKGGPAGGGFSTVRDLPRFGHARLLGQIVSQRRHRPSPAGEQERTDPGQGEGPLRSSASRGHGEARAHDSRSLGGSTCP